MAFMQLEKRVGQKPENHTRLHRKEHTRDALGSKRTDSEIQRRERKEKTEMVKSLAEQSDARDATHATEQQSSTTCCRLRYARCKCHDV